MDDQQPTEMEGARRLTRRQMIKRSAVLGGVVWATPVIDSVLTSASAVSNVNNHHVVQLPGCAGCPGGGGLGCSEYFIVFQKPNDPTFYTVKFDGCKGCASDCGVSGGGTFAVTTCGSLTFTEDKVANPNKVAVNGVDTTCDSANCASDFTISGTTVTALGGNTIVFVGVHDGSIGGPGGSQWLGICG